MCAAVTFCVRQLRQDVEVQRVALHRRDELKRRLQRRPWNRHLPNALLDEAHCGARHVQLSNDDDQAEESKQWPQLQQPQQNNLAATRAVRLIAAPECKCMQ
jgi:hypothetical protein